MANFRFPGIMGREDQSEDHENEKTFRNVAREEGHSSE